jgi:hypothetical protein
VERAAWVAFLGDEFPQYETFWQLFVVGLTMRVDDVDDIGFRPQPDLDEIGRPEWHVAVAQLHYTTLLHLVRANELRRHPIRSRDAFVEAIVRLYAASDTAFELLGRCLTDRGKSDAWREIEGRKVREAWMRQEREPLKLVRRYRNALVHGRVRPEWRGRTQDPASGDTTEILFYTSFEKVESAVDWRDARPEDAEPADHLVNQAWSEVLDYLRTAWARKLVPWATASLFIAPTVTEELSPEQTYLRDLAALRPASADGSDAPYSGGSISWPLPKKKGPLTYD